MIYAVKHNKVDRNQFKLNEDSLTSSVFERLMYLPKEMFQYILENALYETIPDLNLTKLESIEYWPSWNGTNTTNSSRVEPDVFIRTREVDIIIEMKRYDIKQQDPGQWRNQVIAYRNEFKEEQKKLVYIALGGIRTTKTEIILNSDNPVKIYKCKWQRILDEVKEVLYKMESSFNLSNNNTAIYNILSDIILSFGMYGYSTSNWFETFIKPINISQSGINLLSEEWTN